LGQYFPVLTHWANLWHAYGVCAEQGRSVSKIKARCRACLPAGRLKPRHGGHAGATFDRQVKSLRSKDLSYIKPLVKNLRKKQIPVCRQAGLTAIRKKRGWVRDDKVRQGRKEPARRPSFVWVNRRYDHRATLDPEFKSLRSEDLSHIWSTAKTGVTLVLLIF
jgi:hypothetical protein